MCSISSTSLRISAASLLGAISASESLKRVMMVRKSWLTPLSIVVRCSIARSTRRFISTKAAPAWRTSRAPRGLKATSRPLPNSSAARANRRIGRIWLRRNEVAIARMTTEATVVQMKKICELDA